MGRLPQKDVDLIKNISDENEELIRMKLAMNRLTNRICNKCHDKRELSKLSLCSQCGSTWYCNKDCQEKDWDNHIHRCNKQDGPLDKGPMAITLVSVKK